LLIHIHPPLVPKVAASKAPTPLLNVSVVAILLPAVPAVLACKTASSEAKAPIETVVCGAVVLA